MANNYYQATVQPELPASLFTQQELDSLAQACGLRSEPEGDQLYFFAEESFCEHDEDEHGQRINCLELLQAKLKALDPASYPYIAIEGASTCSKMRTGEFGGFAYFITRDDVRSTSSWQWLHQEMARQKGIVP
jgi:hypothetical protein